ncbi:MAG: hypothetical protein LPJ89_03315 [Hymenobacteraceae bacterium]|nr:hypothetical protein [Hymenobacteraceae bacterium]MDX5396977.1 hypothetical protein [Hymenobacteraceae bacterium]MDX5442792.1 hypothetical protein [Hymenobacteraceae bacterium]MDX5513051.1 hypothetical protein [Hymenobacteraceae bacterium]
MGRYKIYGILAALLLLLLFRPFSNEPAARPSAVKPAVVAIKPEPVAVTFPDYTVSASIYYPESNQTDRTPLITADGSRINPKQPRKHRWIAVSRNLLKRWGGPIQYGDSIRVEGISEELDGIYIVHDTMNRRFRNCVDILVGKQDKIMGQWNNVRMYHLNKPLSL